MVSLPLSTRRFRFRTYSFSFASEEAINNLGSLKFSQSNRMPDPKDSSRIVTTTTTTTFSMAKEMARSVCQRFMDARFIEPADGKTVPSFPLKGCLWQLTPKGIHILERFCQRNGIQQEHVLKLLNSPFNTMRLVVLERDRASDKLSHDKTTTEVIFRRFAGPAPNTKHSVSVSDNDSVSDYQDGLTGVKLAETRKIYDKIVRLSFTGKCAVDWLLDCCTTVERGETHEIVGLFAHYGLVRCVLEDKVYVQQNPRAKDFQPTKNAVYIITEKGQRLAGWIEPDRTSLGDRFADAPITTTTTTTTTATTAAQATTAPATIAQVQALAQAQAQATTSSSPPASRAPSAVRGRDDGSPRGNFNSFFHLIRTITPFHSGADIRKDTTTTTTTKISEKQTRPDCRLS